MSFNRDGVVWPVDGGYRYGQFHAEPVNTLHPEDFDPEWDVEYDWNRFHYVSPVKPTPEEAFHCWSGPNPGGYDSWEGGRTDAIREECEHYDRMAAEYEAGEAVRRQKLQALRRSGGFYF